MDLLDGFPRPLFFAHRGLSAQAPENTMAAFRLAWDSGVPGVELDIHLCRSGELVVIHDSDVHRVTGAEGSVEEMEISEIGGLNASATFGPEYSHQGIPLLSDVLQAAPQDTYFDIELKIHAGNAKALAKALAGVLAKYNMAGRCIISSFYPSAVIAAKSQCKAYPAAFIYSDEYVRDHRAKHIIARLLSSAPVLKPQWQQAVPLLERKAKSKPVIPWTIDDPEIAKKCLNLGADGIISNDPTVLM